MQMLVWKIRKTANNWKMNQRRDWTEACLLTLPDYNTNITPKGG